ncbi:MAG: response regulator [Sphingomonas sp.]|nr:response regulator [Sphingomonas sp.]
MTIRILFVDDEADIREVAEISLGLDQDFEIRTCASGKEAVLVAAEWKPDLVLLDVMMPAMDGPTTLARLREQKETAQIPIVFITARTQAQDVERLKLMGAVALIAKPFNPMTLAQTVRQYLKP